MNDNQFQVMSNELGFFFDRASRGETVSKEDLEQCLDNLETVGLKFNPDNLRVETDGVPLMLQRKNNAEKVFNDYVYNTPVKDYNGWDQESSTMWTRRVFFEDGSLVFKVVFGSSDSAEVADYWAE